MTAARGAVAAVGTLLLGVVIGEIGFLRFASTAASANNAAMLEVAARQSSGAAGGQDVTVAAPVAMTMLSGIVFALATPLGWLSSYLTLTGLVRSVAAAVGEQRGDPLIAAGKALAGRWRHRRDRARVERDLAERAGPEVSDRLVRGARVGIDGVDLVVVASRPKREWTSGTVLDCGGRWYSVGEPSERTFPVGLRTLYPLSPIPEAQVFRRIVRYDLPKVID